MGSKLLASLNKINLKLEQLKNKYDKQKQIKIR